jgi:plastocyanin
MRKLMLGALTPRLRLIPIGVLVLTAGYLAIASPLLAGAKPKDRQATVTIPDSDRFIPFALTIRAGDSVHWVNHDSDDHTVVSDDAVNTTGPTGVNEVLPADGGSLTLTFKQPGQFVYFCRFHSHLDEFNQPVAPGPDGGIQDSNGNFGTPMMGVITVVRGNF